MMLQNYIYLLADPFMIALFIVAGLFILAAVLKKIREMRVNKAIEKMPVVKVDDADETDEQAYLVLNRVRTDIWLEWNALKKQSEKDNETEVYSTGLFFSYVMRVSEAIAAIYYPEIKNPHYLARIEDLTTLNNRIFTRVNEILSLPFLKKLKRFNLDTIFKLHSLYTSPLGFVFRNKETRKAMKRISGAINVINPWYWFRQYLTEYSLETATRFFIVKFITIIGEEAVILYGDKEKEKGKSSNEKRLLLAMVRSLDIENRELDAENYEDIYSRIFSSEMLEDHEKMDVLKFLSGKKKFNDKECPVAKLQELEHSRELMGELEEFTRSRGLALPQRSRKGEEE